MDEDGGRGASMEEKVYWKKQSNKEKKIKRFFKKCIHFFLNKLLIYFLKS